MFALLAAVLLAQATPAAPSPSPSPTPAAVSDPCGSLLSIVARPTVTTGVCTVRKGHVDVETGYTNTVTTGTGGGVLVNYPQTFLRAGVGSHAEIAITPPSFLRSSAGGSLITGGSDLNFGAKWELGYTSKALWGVNAVVSLPSGSPAFTAGGPQYTGNFNWGYTLDSTWSLAGTVGFNSLVGTTAAGRLQRYFAVIPSVELTASLPANSQLFGEYVYVSPAGPGFNGKTILDFGYQRDFGSHVQFDIEYGIQPTVVNGQQSHYLGAGLAFMN
jgi:hypothetical protein